MIKSLEAPVFSPTNYSSWIRNSALTPTPIILEEHAIRVYCGFRDDLGVSRIGFVEVSSSNPTKVLRVSNKPCLDIGRSGCFDDNGVILGDIQVRGSEIWMYYVGFQQVKKAKFLAFTGLAISKDRGETFSRYSEVPVLDRVEGGTTIRALHSVNLKDGLWTGWLAKGNDWEIINGTAYPRYNIWEVKSYDGINFFNERLVVDNNQAFNEYRIGRPSMFEINKQQMMFFTKGSTSGKDYFPGMAYKNEKSEWIRRDELFPLGLSESGWDSIHLCYPRLIEHNGRYFIFYNGNNMGLEGFGVKEVTLWAHSVFRDIQTKTN